MVDPEATASSTEVDNEPEATTTIVIDDTETTDTSSVASLDIDANNETNTTDDENLDQPSEQPNVGTTSASAVDLLKEILSETKKLIQYMVDILSLIHISEPTRPY